MQLLAIGLKNMWYMGVMRRKDANAVHESAERIGTVVARALQRAPCDLVLSLTPPHREAFD